MAHLISGLLDEDVETYNVLLSSEEDLEEQFEKSKFVGFLSSKKNKVNKLNFKSYYFQIHLDLALESGILSKETSCKRSAMGFEFDEIWSDQDAELKLLQAKLYSKIQCKGRMIYFSFSISS